MSLTEKTNKMRLSRPLVLRNHHAQTKMALKNENKSTQKKHEETLLTTLLLLRNCGRQKFLEIQGQNGARRDCYCLESDNFSEVGTQTNVALKKKWEQTRSENYE